jgi:hypothetical protein
MVDALVVNTPEAHARKRKEGPSKQKQWAVAAVNGVKSGGERLAHHHSLTESTLLMSNQGLLLLSLIVDPSVHLIKVLAR